MGRTGGLIDLIIVPEDDGGAMVFVDGTIDDRPYRFLLDTGATRTAVTADDQLATLAAEPARSSPGIFAAPTADETVILPSLTIGPIVRVDLPVTRIRAGAGRPHATLVGMDVLKDFALHVRFGERRVLVDPPPDDRPAETLPLYLDATDHPYVPVDFDDGAVANAVWDTGASMTVVDAAFVARHRGHFTEEGSSVGTDASGTAVETPLYRMGPVTIGGVAFLPHRVATVDLGPINATIPDPMDMILGYTTLAQADWWMDFVDRRWSVTARHPARP